MSAAATSSREILEQAIVWDNVWPLAPEFGNHLDALPRFAEGGWDVLSLLPRDELHRVSDALLKQHYRDRATPAPVPQPTA